MLRKGTKPKDQKRGSNFKTSVPTFCAARCLNFALNLFIF